MKQTPATKPNFQSVVHLGVKATATDKLALMTNNSTTRYAWCKRNMLRFFNRSGDERHDNRNQACFYPDYRLPMLALLSPSKTRFRLIDPRKEGRWLILQLLPRGFSLALIATVAAIHAAGLSAQTACDPPASELWELSTRHLSCSLGCLSDPPRFEVHRWGGCRWEEGELDEVFQASAICGENPLTILYVHGNWMERSNALQRVRIVDQYIRRRATEPYRLIMLSWPSQHDAGLVKEVRDNALCADLQSHYLGWVLRKLQQQGVGRIALLGFSFGARTVVGAIHLDAGGSVFQRPLPASTTGVKTATVVAEPVTLDYRPTYRVSLVAPAVDRNWLEPCGRYAQAMSRVEHLVNLYNSRDPILRRFRFIDNISRPIAAGFAGLEAVSDPPSTQPLHGHGRIEQYDCQQAIGGTHNELSYYGECPYFRRAIDNLLWK
jgi:pimeloyl-ACP methyl ester carboxylesterase